MMITSNWDEFWNYLTSTDTVLDITNALVSAKSFLKKNDNAKEQKCLENSPEYVGV